MTDDMNLQKSSWNWISERLSDCCYEYLHMTQIKTFMSLELQFFFSFRAFFILKITNQILLNPLGCLFNNWVGSDILELLRVSLKVFQKFLFDLSVLGGPQRFDKSLEPFQFALHIVEKLCFVCGFQVGFDRFVILLHWWRGSILRDWGHAIVDHRER